VLSLLSVNPSSPLKVVPGGEQKRVREISIDDVHERQDRGEPRFEILDVRDDAAWRAGHIPGARHFAPAVLEREVEKAIPDTAGEIVVYCERGLQSARAAATLVRKGYTRVSSLAGGWQRWVSEGGEVEK
jgi:sulfur-carrier protein adenylyltransferase/sulfurtransferase